MEASHRHKCEDIKIFIKMVSLGSSYSVHVSRNVKFANIHAELLEAANNHMWLFFIFSFNT